MNSNLIKTTVIIILILVIIRISKINIKKSFPRFNLTSYQNTNNTLNLSQISLDSTLVLVWLPMNSCGICLRNVVEVLCEANDKNGGVVITTSNNPVNYNWVKIQSSLINDEWKLYFLSKIESEKYHNFLIKNTDPAAYLLDNNLHIKKKIILNSSKASIESIFKYLSK